MSNEATKDLGRVALLKPVRALFINVITAKAFKQNGQDKGEPKFDGTFQLDAEDIKPLAAAVASVARAKWPGRDLKEIDKPFKTYDQVVAWAKEKGKDASIYKPGHYYVTARSKFAPTLSRFVKGVPTAFGASDADRAEAKQKFYHGCWVVPSLNFVTYNKVRANDKDGVNAYLDGLLWIKDDTRIGGAGANPADVFKAYVGTITNIDPTGGQPAEDPLADIIG